MEKAERKSRGFLAWLRGASLEQARDTGLAMVLICLLLAYWSGRPRFLPAAILLLVVTMAWPRVFRPLARLWFGLSHLLGAVVSRIVLTLIFFLLVTPIGLIRRLSGADALQLRQWKKDRGSVFKVRGGAIPPEDLGRPY